MSKGKFRSVSRGVALIVSISSSTLVQRGALAFTTFALLLGAAGCGGEPTASTGASARPGGSAAPSGSASAAAANGPTLAEGEVDLPDGKGTVKFTVTLPPGLVNVSDGKVTANYARSKDDDVGPIVRISTPLRADATLEAAVAEAEQKKLPVLKKEKLANGWLMATQHDKDKVILVNARLDGEPSALTCFAFSKGDQALAAKEATIAVLEKACRSITHKK